MNTYTSVIPRFNFPTHVNAPSLSALIGFLLIGMAYITTATHTRAEDMPPPKASSDSDALSALHKMGAYLHTLKSFGVRAESTREEVLDDGQKLQFAMSTDVTVRAPDRMRAQVRSDNFERQFFYDGKTFTVSAPKMNYYASVPAPATLSELVDHINDRFEIEMPLADLFLWGKGDGGNQTNVTGAISVGDSEIDGVACAHYAFRQEGLDWQIWIQKGDKPLPRKVLLTTLTDEARPQFCAIYTWDLEPTLKDDAFAFTPSTNAVKVALARGDNTAVKTK